jgi:hypothetical protein
MREEDRKIDLEARQAPIKINFLRFSCVPQNQTAQTPASFARFLATLAKAKG